MGQGEAHPVSQLASFGRKPESKREVRSWIPAWAGTYRCYRTTSRMMSRMVWELRSSSTISRPTITRA